MKKIIIGLILFLITSCSYTNKKKSVGSVKKCVINEIEVRPEISTIEVGNLYVYHTDCGEVISSRSFDIHQIGDTIIYMDKRDKS